MPREPRSGAHAHGTRARQAARCPRLNAANTALGQLVAPPAAPPDVLPYFETPQTGADFLEFSEVARARGAYEANEEYAAITPRRVGQEHGGVQVHCSAAFAGFFRSAASMSAHEGAVQ